MTDIRRIVNNELSDKRLAELQQASIDESSPGPLLANIEILIDFIGTGLKTTSDYYVLPLAVLAELNAALVDPLLHEFKRPQLRSFPTLMGLFMLLRGCGLAVGQAKPQRVVMIDPAALEQWRSSMATTMTIPVDQTLRMIICKRCNAHEPKFR